MTSIKRMEQELRWVKETRNNIAMLLADIADVNVLIGGSYALKYQCDCFADREISDYDFIIKVHQKDVPKVHEFFHTLERLHLASQGYSGNGAWKLPHAYMGRHAECIIHPMDDSASIHSARIVGRIWEKPLNVIQAKEEYVASYKAKGLEPRPKDIADIENYYKNEDLPF